jgi:hypothetical protein
MKRAMNFLFILVAVFLTACSSLPKASMEQDAAAKSFALYKDKSTIYIYRNEMFGAAIQMDVLVNNKPLGKTGPKTYFSLTVPPGKYSIISKSESDSILNLEVEAGKNYFVWQEVKMGVLFARSLLQFVDESKGKSGVQECSLISTTAQF